MAQKKNSTRFCKREKNNSIFDNLLDYNCWYTSFNSFHCHYGARNVRQDSRIWRFELLWTTTRILCGNLPFLCPSIKAFTGSPVTTQLKPLFPPNIHINGGYVSLVASQTKTCLTISHSDQKLIGKRPERNVNTLCPIQPWLLKRIQIRKNKKIFSRRCGITLSINDASFHDFL